MASVIGQAGAPTTHQSNQPKARGQAFVRYLELASDLSRPHVIVGLNLLVAFCWPCERPCLGC